MTRIKRKVERTLDEDAIVDAALKLVRRHGIEKLKTAFAESELILFFIVSAIIMLFTGYKLIC